MRIKTRLRLLWIAITVKSFEKLNLRKCHYIETIVKKIRFNFELLHITMKG